MLKVMTRIKRCHRPCLYYSNCSAAFRCVMIYDIVFKLNPGPNGPLTRNPNNLITVERSGMSLSDNRSLKICSLNARSLRNKSAAFVELVNDLKADLFTICETWLSFNDSAVLNELTPTGYNTLYHCPRSGRRGGGTALLVRKGFVSSKISCVVVRVAC